ncbi:MAG: hypothetical protein VYE28_01210 [Planctomycetota bacterium]|nr:hypothetical protein [Planctomycetota bacterium]
MATVSQPRDGRGSTYGLNRRDEVANAACDFSKCHHTGSGRFPGEPPQDTVGKEIPSRQQVDA